MDKFQLSDLLSFEKVIAPTVIKIVYYIGLVGIGLALLFGVFTAFGDYGGGITQVLTSIVGCAFGALMLRIAMELYIAIFGMYDRLGEIRDLLKK